MSETTKRKDVFLCHTSSDKQEIIHPFIKELDKRGISYWIDEAEIEWGDPISKKINEGLRISKYVLVFLSEAFIGRNWAESELDASISKENNRGEKVVLPIIIGDKNVMFNHYPLLRGKHCKFWNEGIVAIAEELESMLKKERKELNYYVLDLSKDDLLKELVSLEGILDGLSNTIVRRSNVIFLANNLLSIVLAKYGFQFKEYTTNVLGIFKRELRQPSKGNHKFHKEFPQDLKKLNIPFDELQENIEGMDSFIKREKHTRKSSETVLSKLRFLCILCSNLLAIGDSAEDTEIRKLLAKLEGVNLEFKSSMRWDMNAKKKSKEIENQIAKAVAGFMNKEGGTLVIGVDDFGNPIGLEKDFSTFRGRDVRRSRDTYERSFDQVIANRLGGLTTCLLINKRFVNVSKNIVVFIAEVEKSDGPIYFSDKKEIRFYVRIGNSTRAFNVKEAIEYYEIRFRK